MPSEMLQPSAAVLGATQHTDKPHHLDVSLFCQRSVTLGGSPLGQSTQRSAKPLGSVNATLTPLLCTLSGCCPGVCLLCKVSVDPFLFLFFKLIMQKIFRRVKTDKSTKSQLLNKLKTRRQINVFTVEMGPNHAKLYKLALKLHARHKKM